MKIPILLLLVSLFYLNVNSQKKMTDKEFEGLQGKVKSVYTDNADLQIQNGKPIIFGRETDFDELYDKDGNMTQNSFYYMGDRRTFVFIDGEKTAKITQFKPSRASIAIDEKKIDDSKPRDPRYDLKFKYEYDANGRIIKEIIYRNDGTLFTKTDYQYNDKGKLIGEIWYLNDKISKNIFYAYDAKGILTEKKSVPTGVNGETDPAIFLFKDYKFDAQGNWIQRTQTTIYYRNGKKLEPQRIYYRKIEYYK